LPRREREVEVEIQQARGATPRTRRASAVALALVIGLAAAFHAGCGDNGRELFVRPFDAGTDESASARADAPPDFDPTLGGPCAEDAQCDDRVPCTYDACDPALSRCRNVPDDAQCDDGAYCNGKEVCVPRLGCGPGPVVTCQDGDPCTIDTCVEATASCQRAVRDVDGDGDPDDHCVGKKDCDDADPSVSSLKKEVCDNGKDDDCDGVVDEADCARPDSDVCASARAVTSAGTVLLSTVATKKDYATSCSVRTPAAAVDVVVAVTVPGAPGDGARDVRVWATADAVSNEVAVALQATCGQAASELACGNVPRASEARAIARGVAAGSTVYAVVTTQVEGAVSLRVETTPATTKPLNEGCTAPIPVAIDAPFTVSLIDPDPANSLPSACSAASAPAGAQGAATGELTYAFTLTEPRDVRVFASTLAGAGAPVVTLRDAADASCQTELRCRVGASSGNAPPLFARALPAGTHVIGVAGTTQIDASVLVKTYAPTTPPATQSCATAPPIAANAKVAVDLSAQEDALRNGCLSGGLAAAYTLELAAPSDVLAVGRFVQGTLGGVSISAPACGTPDLLACREGTTPVRASRRNLPAGSYRVVLANTGGQPADLTAFVRGTVPPAVVSASDGCVGTAVIPASGGFFTGDTTGKQADFGSACDAPGAGLGGAPDQLLRLDLSQKKRVVLDMSGSTYATLLAIREGTACPGIEVPDACYAGFAPGTRSFLERVLDPGTYWIQVDGYGGDKGTWNLDVRVLDP
jgi:hypothetical protein